MTKSMKNKNLFELTEISTRKSAWDWALTVTQSYVVVALSLRYFSVLQPIKLIMNIPEIYTKLFPVCKVEILQVTVNKIEVSSTF